MEIYAHDGTIIMVDKSDYDFINQFKWWSQKDKRINRTSVYTQVTTGKNENRKYVRFLLHHLLLGKPPEGMVVDHINGNPLDNRRNNLRICSSSQNNMNRKISIRNKSGYKGVSWSQSTNKWKAKITVNKKCLTIGYFENKIEAKKAYDEAGKKYFGEFFRSE